VGKSTLALQIALHGAIQTKQAVYYASTEMPGKSLADRIIGRETGIQPQFLRSGQIHGDAQWRSIALAIGRMSDVPIIIDDGDLTTQSIWSACRRIQLERPLGLIVIDNLTMLADRPAKGQTDTSLVTEMSRRVKSMARALRVPVICVSQLNRLSERENRAPRMSDLRQSGAIEQDADVIVFLHTDESELKQDPRPVQLMVAKNRNGGIGDCPMVFFRSQQRIEPADMRHTEARPLPPRQNRLGEYDDNEEEEQHA
jgi:replicative DNA helicase